MMYSFNEVFDFLNSTQPLTYHSYSKYDSFLKISNELFLNTSSEEYIQQLQDAVCAFQENFRKTHNISTDTLLPRYSVENFSKKLICIPQRESISFRLVSEDFFKNLPGSYEYLDCSQTHFNNHIFFSHFLRSPLVDSLDATWILAARKFYNHIGKLIDDPNQFPNHTLGCFFADSNIAEKNKYIYNHHATLASVEEDALSRKVNPAYLFEKRYSLPYEKNIEKYLFNERQFRKIHLKKVLSKVDNRLTQIEQIKAIPETLFHFFQS